MIAVIKDTWADTVEERCPITKEGTEERTRNGWRWNWMNSTCVRETSTSRRGVSARSASRTTECRPVRDRTSPTRTETISCRYRACRSCWPNVPRKCYPACLRRPWRGPTAPCRPHRPRRGTTSTRRETHRPRRNRRRTETDVNRGTCCTRRPTGQRNARRKPSRRRSPTDYTTGSETGNRINPHLNKLLLVIIEVFLTCYTHHCSIPDDKVFYLLIRFLVFLKGQKIQA